MMILVLFFSKLPCCSEVSRTINLEKLLSPSLLVYHFYYFCPFYAFNQTYDGLRSMEKETELKRTEKENGKGQ